MSPFSCTSALIFSNVRPESYHSIWVETERFGAQVKHQKKIPVSPQCFILFGPTKLGRETAFATWNDKTPWWFHSWCESVRTPNTQSSEKHFEVWSHLLLVQSPSSEEFPPYPAPLPHTREPTDSNTGKHSAAIHPASTPSQTGTGCSRFLCSSTWNTTKVSSFSVITIFPNQITHCSRSLPHHTVRNKSLRNSFSGWQLDTLNLNSWGCSLVVRFFPPPGFLNVFLSFSPPTDSFNFFQCSRQRQIRHPEMTADSSFSWKADVFCAACREVYSKGCATFRLNGWFLADLIPQPFCTFSQLTRNHTENLLCAASKLSQRTNWKTWQIAKQNWTPGKLLASSSKDQELPQDRSFICFCRGLTKLTTIPPPVQSIVKRPEDFVSIRMLLVWITWGPSTQQRLLMTGFFLPDGQDYVLLSMEHKRFSFPWQNSAVFL